MRLSCLILIVYVASSCQEYTAHYPTGSPTERTLKSPYTGEWKYISGINLDSTKSIGYGPHILRITPFNEDEFLVQLIADSLNSIKDIDQFRGFIDQIKDSKIANISPIDNPDSRPLYSVYKFKLSGDTLKFWGISNKKYKSLNTFIGSAKDHRRFIQRQLDAPEVWDMAYQYVKKIEE